MKVGKVCNIPGEGSSREKHTNEVGERLHDGQFLRMKAGGDCAKLKRADNIKKAPRGYQGGSGLLREHKGVGKKILWPLENAVSRRSSLHIAKEGRVELRGRILEKKIGVTTVVNSFPSWNQEKIALGRGEEGRVFLLSKVRTGGGGGGGDPGTITIYVQLLRLLG